MGKHVFSLRLINRISAAWVILFCFVPSVQVASVYRLLAIAASVLWVVTALLIDSSFINRKVMNFIIIGLLCVVLMFLWRSNAVSMGTAFSYIIQPTIMILIALISMFAYKNDTKFLNIMLTIVLILVCYYCLVTIKATIENPYASRVANSEWLEERFKGNENVGLYGYVYMCVFFVPILLYKFVKRVSINRLADIVAYAAFALILAMVIFAGYMIAIACTIVGILMIIMLYKKSIVRTIVVMVIGVIFLIYQQQIISAIIEFVAQIVGDNPVYSDKLDGFLRLYQEGELGDSSWGGRFSNYAASFQDIMEYPVAGSYLFGDTGGGGHSTVLDTIGKYGWVTAFLYFNITWRYPRKIIPYNIKRHALYTTVLILSIMFGFLDPYCQEMALPWFFVMPYIVYLENEQIKIKNDN